MQNLKNPLLNAAEQKIESQVLPANRQSYLKIVVAGMHAALDKGSAGILASLRQSRDPVSDAARGAVSLVLILRKQARGVMPLKAMVPAAMTLMLTALDFAEGAGLVKVDQNVLVRATHIFTNDIFARFHITPQMLASATQKVHALTQDPTAVQAINQHAGVAPPPAASEGA